MSALIGCWFALILTSRPQDVIKILHRGQQGHAPFPSLGKPNFWLFSVLK